MKTNFVIHLMIGLREKVNFVSFRISGVLVLMGLKNFLREEKKNQKSACFGHALFALQRW